VADATPAVDSRVDALNKVPGFRYLVYLTNGASGKRILKIIDLCDQKQRNKRLSHLFTIDAHIPKLDVDDGKQNVE
jgi:hypothetical protein